MCAGSAPRFGILWTSISNIKLVTGMNMDRSSPVSSDASSRATWNKFPLPSAWPPGYNNGLSFLWWIRTVDLQSGATNHVELVRCPSRQLLSRLLGWDSINLKVWRFAISSVWSNDLCVLIRWYISVSTQFFGLNFSSTRRSIYCERVCFQYLFFLSLTHNSRSFSAPD